MATLVAPVERSQSSPRTSERLWAAVVFLISFVIIGWRIEANGIAAGYSDPVAHLRAQDESIYVNCAISTAQRGDWLTPKLMGRLFLFKPPLLIWLTAASLKIFGWSLLAVRLPALFFGAAGISAVFLWTARARSPGAGAIAAGLLLLDPLWRTFSQLCYTDVLTAALNTFAGAVLALDPRMERRRSALLFGAFAGASIMTKNIAGVLPFAALALYFIVMPKQSKPKFSRIVQAALTALVLAAPWHIYQASLHPQWFWADYVKVQLLGIGVDAVSAGGEGLPLWFYLRRLAVIDPLLSVAAVIALAGALRTFWNRRSGPEIAALCWTVTVLAALSVFQARNLPYAVLLVPALCVLSGIWAPRGWDRTAIVIAITAVLFAIKLAAPAAAWSLRLEAPPLEGAAAMRTYYYQNRDTELITADTDDQFYSATIPLEQVRYCFVDPSGWVPRFAPQYVYLGITMKADEFERTGAAPAEYVRRLRDWGLADPRVIATTILLREPADLLKVVAGRPKSDYYVPASWAPELTSMIGRTHEAIPFSPERLFLLARGVRARMMPRRPLPARW